MNIVLALAVITGLFMVRFPENSFDALAGGRLCSAR